jgi:hypothetical protein
VKTYHPSRVAVDRGTGSGRVEILTKAFRGTEKDRQRKCARYLPEMVSCMFVKRTLPKDVFAGLSVLAARASDGLRRHESPVVLAAEGMPGDHLRDAGGDGALALEVPKVLLGACGGW